MPFCLIMRALALSWDGRSSLARLSRWLSAPSRCRCETPRCRIAQQEEDFRFILLLAEAAHNPWTEMCVSQADCVLVVGRTGDQPAPSDAERRLLWRAPRKGSRVELLLLHPAPRSGYAPMSAPVGTAAWLNARPLVKSFQHARMGSELDMARLARHLAGRAVGLLLTGSGGRGLLHLGALRALADANVPVDVVGGTGHGALVGAAYARSASTRHLLSRCRSFASLVVRPSGPRGTSRGPPLSKPRLAAHVQRPARACRRWRPCAPIS